MAASPELLKAAAAALVDPHAPLETRERLFRDLMKAEAYKAALPLGRAVYEAEPTLIRRREFIIALWRADQLEEAETLLHAHREELGETYFNVTMCTLRLRAKDNAGAAHYGSEALRLKDKSIKPLETAPEFIRHRFNPDAPKRNIISFTLYGDHPRYIEGAYNNAIAARYLYPDWRCRFYIDDSVPVDAVRRLHREGAQTAKVEGWGAGAYGVFWRFLIEDDPEVDFYLVRDVDSVVNMKERAAVEDWIKSGKAFHILRDNPWHCELILAGMWGGQRGNVGDMREKIAQHVALEAAQEKRRGAPNSRHTDQRFLARTVWPLARLDGMIHDSWFDAIGAAPYRNEFHQPARRHIGDNDWGMREAEKQRAAIARARAKAKAKA